VALKIMEEEAAKMCKTVDPDMLKKTKELMLKQADDNAKTNAYWVNAIGTYDEFGVDTVTPYKDAVNALTPAKVAKFMKKVIFGGGNHVKVVMLPEAETK
jgi:zinc protease